jgi:ABC-type transport system involved in multi-copper enzyme maturation permease subunit
MFSRIATIALNTYREAVRARVLLGVFALGLATCAYSAVVGTLSLHNEERVVADLGAAAVSLYGVVIAIVLGSTSLYRELEHRTVFPILSRPIRRWEYMVGKYLGIVLTVAVFVAAQAAAIFMLLAVEAGRSAEHALVACLVALAIVTAAMVRLPRVRDFVVVPCALVGALAAWALAAPSFQERQLVAASAVLAVSEVGIVAAVATLFSSFSSPFLTAVCTTMVFLIGRSADTLARLPPKLFGPGVAVGRVLARVFPNLHAYVPARTLLLGQVSGQPVGSYVAAAVLNAIAYSTVLLVVGSLAFRRRDFS